MATRKAGNRVWVRGQIHDCPSTFALHVPSDVRGWIPGATRVSLEPLGLVRVPYAQFDQQPGVYSRLPGATTDVQGLYLSGEYLHSSSIHGAMRGGEIAAREVVEGLESAPM